MSDWWDRVIAVDGPAASGKGTLARRLARHFNFAHLDTGKLYRAAGFLALEQQIDPNDESQVLAVAKTLSAQDLSGDLISNKRLFAEDVAMAASIVAQHRGVRRALFDLQRSFAAEPPPPATGAVLDGRDIGTVICPEAAVKFFVTASLEARADRRHKELLDRGEASIHAEILADLEARDHRDATRAIAPTRAANDAVEIDTSSMSADQVFARALVAVAERTDGRSFGV